MAKEDPADRQRTRLDKWLWAARFYRTRSLASAAVESGQVRVGGERVKPARALREGEIVAVRRTGLVWEVVVTALAERRGSAADAAKLYRETAASAAVREGEVAKRRAAAGPRLDGRPTKRDRRRLQDFLDEP